MNEIVPPKVYELIKRVVNEDIEKYSISVHEANKKGDGYLGELCFISLQDNNSGELFNFVVKQAFNNEFTRSANPIRNVFMNEIYFYTKIWPCFQQFQTNIPLTKTFNKVAKCFGATSEDGFEKIVLENLKFQNYVIFDINKTFDGTHIEYIFKQYGAYHALSFAYRILHPKEYSELSEGLNDIYLDFTERKYFQDAIELIHDLSLKSLQPGKDDKIIQKYKYYVENGVKLFNDSNNYKGSYSAILHGDCWSNNMMFKYDDSGKLNDMRFIDFQLSKNGTPIIDLSYCLYAGGSKEVWDHLDYYLEVYHSSLSETLKEFGLQSEDIYPVSALKNEWKQHCQLGFTMALMIWKSKLTYDDDKIQLSEITDEADDIAKKFIDGNYDEITFKHYTRDLIMHMYENDFLINH